MSSTQKRAEYVAGLRALADLIEQHDDLPTPYGVTAQWINVSSSQEDQRRIAQTFARVMPGKIDKGVRDDAFDLDGHVGAVEVSMIVSRNAVCRRVVKDVREVTREIPDPDALAAVPTVTVTETVEDVEWVCEPLLADREQVSA